MRLEQLQQEAISFRQAIIKARDLGEFIPESNKTERMNRFPYDCCDDTADLFAHYLYSKYRIDSIRVDGTYFNDRLGCTCGHSWQKVGKWIVDLTGDQFKDDSSIQIKSIDVYVGNITDFHRQFTVVRKEHSCGIESLDEGCRKRMYRLFKIIEKHIYDEL